MPDSFVAGPVRPGAILYTLEGDFGFSAANGSPEVGHEVRLMNVAGQGAGPLSLSFSNFARNTTGDQAFVTGIHGMNRPTNLRFGPDGCAWVVDYGAVRDAGQSGVDTKFKNPADALLLQIPNTGVIFRICRD